jgi:hypothetical protein
MNFSALARYLQKNRIKKLASEILFINRSRGSWNILAISAETDPTFFRYWMNKVPCLISHVSRNFLEETGPFKCEIPWQKKSFSFCKIFFPCSLLQGASFAQRPIRPLETLLGPIPIIRFLYNILPESENSVKRLMRRIFFGLVHFRRREFSLISAPPLQESFSVKMNFSEIRLRRKWKVPL